MLAAQITVDEVTVSLVTGVLLPILIGVILRENNPNWVKEIVGAAVAVIATLVKEAIQSDGTAILSEDTVVAFFLIWLPQVAAYYKVWKPVGINTLTGPGVIDVSSKPVSPVS